MNLYTDKIKYLTPSLNSLNTNEEVFIYPIARVLRNKIIESGKDPKEIAAKYGYNHFLFNKYFSKSVVNKIAWFVKVDKPIFNQALEDTQLLVAMEKYLEELPSQISNIIHELSDHVNFKPFIYLITERERPSSITVAAMCGGAMKYLRLKPEITDSSYEDQISQVREIILKDYEKRKGICSLFGPITGYYYQMESHTTIEFDNEGSVVQEIKNFLPKPNPINRK